MRGVHEREKVEHTPSSLNVPGEDKRKKMCLNGDTRERKALSPLQTQAHCGKRGETGHEKVVSTEFASPAPWAHSPRVGVWSAKGNLSVRESVTQFRMFWDPSKRLGSAKSRVRITEQEERGRGAGGKQKREERRKEMSGGGSGEEESQGQGCSGTGSRTVKPK